MLALRHDGDGVANDVDAEANEATSARTELFKLSRCQVVVLGDTFELVGVERVRLNVVAILCESVRPTSTSSTENGRCQMLSWNLFVLEYEEYNSSTRVFCHIRFCLFSSPLLAQVIHYCTREDEDDKQTRLPPG